MHDIENDPTGTYTAACSACDVAFDAAEPNGIVAFFERHHRVTGHDIEVMDAPDAADPVEHDDVARVVRERQGDHCDGVPIGVIVAVLAEGGYSVGETVDEIRRTRNRGVLYEPVDGHLRAV